MNIPWLMSDSESDDALPLPELRMLMEQLSIKDGDGLAIVVEVRRRLAEDWLAGRAVIPAQVGIMLHALIGVNRHGTH